MSGARVTLNEVKGTMTAMVPFASLRVANRLYFTPNPPTNRHHTTNNANP